MNVNNKKIKTFFELFHNIKKGLKKLNFYQGRQKEALLSLNFRKAQTLSLKLMMIIHHPTCSYSNKIEYLERGNISIKFSFMQREIIILIGKKRVQTYI